MPLAAVVAFVSCLCFLFGAANSGLLLKIRDHLSKNTVGKFFRRLLRRFKTLPAGTPYITAWYTTRIRESSAPQKPTRDVQTYDTLSVDLSNDPHFVEDA